RVKKSFSKKPSSPLLPSSSGCRRRRAGDGVAHRWRSPCPRATPFATGATTLVGGSRRCPSGDRSCGCYARSRLPCKLAPSQKGAPPWVLPLRVLPTPASTNHAYGRLHLLAVALAVGGCAVPAGSCPLQAALAVVGCHVGAWPWVDAPAGGMAMAGHPYRWSGHGWLPLLAMFTVKTQQEHVEQFYAIQSHYT
ncbi:hypothetical protein BHE74_00026624, partial [Ensete ventricosum]